MLLRSILYSTESRRCKSANQINITLEKTLANSQLERSRGHVEMLASLYKPQA